MIQEVFAFLFKSEGGEEVNEQLDQADKKTKQLDKDSQSLSDALMKVVTSAAALTAAWKTFYNLVNINNQNDQLYLMSQISGASAESIAQLGFAMEQFGGNANTASHAIMGLERNIMQLRKTGSGPIMQAAMWYGIGISTDPEKMLKNIARRMETLPRRMKFDLGRMMGLDNATILLLSKGVQNFEKELERAKKYTFIDEKKVEQAHELKKTISEMSAVIGGIGIDTLTTISPAVQAIVEFLRDGLAYLREHQEFLGIIGGIVAGIGAAFASWKVVGVILSPLGAIVAAIVAAALAAEDLYMYFTGNNSAIGKLLQKFPELKPYVDAFGKAVKDAWNYFAEGKFIDDFKTQWNKLAKWWENFKADPFKSLREMFDEFVKFLNDLGVKDSFSKSLENIKKIVIPIWDAFLEKVKAVRDSISNLASEIKNQFKAAVDAIVESFEKFGEVLRSLAVDVIWEKIKQIGQWFSDIGTGISNGISGFFGFGDEKAVIANKPANDFSPLDAINKMQAANAETKAIGNAAAIMNTYNTVNNSDVSKPVNNNVEVNITAGTIDMNNAYDIGQELGTGLTQAVGQYNTGVR